MTDERRGTKRDDEREKDGGRKGGKSVGNLAHAVSMLFTRMYVYVGQAELYREDMGRMEREGKREEGEGGGGCRESGIEGEERIDKEKKRRGVSAKHTRDK